MKKLLYKTRKTQGVERLGRRLVCASLFIACTIQAQGQTQEPFVTTWEVTAGDLSITIPTNITIPANSYDYTVDWGDGTTDTTTYTDDATYTYQAAGTYTVAISGDFPAIYFNNTRFFPQAGDNSLKIKTIKSWGTQRWLTLNRAFEGCENLTTVEDGAGVPDLTMVTSMSQMFSGATSFNGDISTWDVSNVTSMWGAFRDATSFNQDLSSWNVSNVNDMDRMFKGATSFNQDISSWDVSKVGSVDSVLIGMPEMFSGATNFNSDLSSWNVSNVTNMYNMFTNATSFSSENYDALLTGWSSLSSLQDDVNFGAPPTTYCNGKAGRGILTGTYNWSISGDSGEDCLATSVDDEFLSNTKIYPNPSNDKISIESSFEIDKLELYNVLGAKLFSVSKTNTLDLTSLSQGIYILKAFSGDKKISRKIIKN